MFTLPATRAARARPCFARRWRRAACAWLLLCVGVMAAACADRPQTAAPELAAPTEAVVAEAAPTPTPTPVAASPADADRAAEAQAAAETPPEAEAPSEAETDSATEAAAPAVSDWTQFVAVEGDYYLLGNPEAPVLILDVSDFL